ncbi:unnamed protein product [Porites lobata]|uniref:Reverse transcriptase domain-containing protein n=1 Tax=Porites lobata TaxID=104759 RepID=A0ABN8P6N6_9CNID|nr:unnamed protein product [Porites lobata]
MMFTDDSAVIAHSSDDIQSLVDSFTRPASQFGLSSTLGKLSAYTTTAVKRLNRYFYPVSELTTITINQEALMQCYDFKYLGSTISNNASQDIELRYRMAIASAAFGKPQDRFGKTGMCLLKSSAMSIKMLSFLPSSVVLKHAWTIHQRK